MSLVAAAVCIPKRLQIIGVLVPLLERETPTGGPAKGAEEGERGYYFTTPVKPKG